MKPSRMIVLDLDGTVLNSQAQFDCAIIDFSKLKSLPSYDVKKMAVGYTNPQCNDLGCGVALHDQKALQDELNVYMNYEFINHKRYIPELFPDMRETLNQLESGYALGVVTAGYRAMMLARFEHLGLTQTFPHYRTLDCAEERNYKIKPEPHALLCLMKEMGYEASDVVMVGDTDADIQMAHSAKVKSIAVTWGVHPEEQLTKVCPTRIVHEVKHLPKAIAEVYSL